MNQIAPSLVEVIEDLIAAGKEGDHWDFERERHAEAGDLIKDVACLANTPLHVGDRFIIYGVDDTGTVVGVPPDHPRTQADIVDTFVVSHNILELRVFSALRRIGSA